MQKIRKRKQQVEADGRFKTAKMSSDDWVEEAYPCHRRPTPGECRAMRDELLGLHGASTIPRLGPLLLDHNAHLEEETVLDGLVKTVLSQNTTDLNSQMAFPSLKSVFLSWKHVACVLMFNLQQDDFPVDTHVVEIARTIGWVPSTVSGIRHTFISTEGSQMNLSLI